MTPPVVIGVGNEWRGDDAIGIVVARHAARALPEVTVVELDGEPARLIDAWSNRRLAVVVDGMRSGATPGSVAVWHDADAGVPAGSLVDSHSAGVADAIALGRSLQRMPDVLIVVGIEIADAAPGRHIDNDVAAAVPRAVEAVVAAVQAGSRATSPAGE